MNGTRPAPPPADTQLGETKTELKSGMSREPTSQGILGAAYGVDVVTGSRKLMAHALLPLLGRLRRGDGSQKDPRHRHGGL